MDPTFGQATGDAFDVLHLPPEFELDGQVLAERHRTLSLALHPDRFAGRPAAERRLSLERAIEVNSAFRTLRDPIARAELLARRLGIALHGETVLSPEQLERAMERREQLAEAVLAADRARIAELAQQGKAEQDELCRQLAELLSPGSASAPARATRVAEVVSTLRFLRRFIDSAEAELDAHGT